MHRETKLKLLLGSILLVALIHPTCSSTLSRKKRFLVFPTNSIMTLSACLAKGGIILSPPVFVYTFDWDLAFQLPNDTSLLRRFSPAYRINRRDRRDLYNGIEALLDRKGFNGRACVLRALCEAQQNLSPERGELMEEIIHAMFTLPPHQDDNEDFFSLDPNDDDFRFLSQELKDHDIAHNHGRALRDCSALYSSCPVSLLDLALW